MAAFYLDKPHAKWLGVCAGVANRLDVDPVLIRILTVVLALSTSLVPMLLLYVVIALVASDRP